MLESLSPIDVALMKKIGGNGSSYTLPIASPMVLGGVKPVAKTDAMTQSVGVDEAGGLWAPEASGGGSSDWTYQKIALTEAVSAINLQLDNAKEVVILANLRINNADNTLSNAIGQYYIRINGCITALTNCYIRDSAKFTTWHMFKKIKSLTDVSTSGPYDGGSRWSESKSIMKNAFSETLNDKNEYINTIFIAPFNNSEWVFPSGCVVEVWSK